MNRFESYAGIAAALLFGAAMALLFGGDAVPPSPVMFAHDIPALQVSATSSSSPLPTAALTTTPAVVQEVATPSPAPKKATSVSAPKSATPAPVPTAAFVPAPSDAALNAAASALRDALVNIICYASLGGGLHSISGSGVIIDPKGIILTNAHIGQYFLLADHSVSCSVRSGSPAATRYVASLIYISPAWLTRNAKVLSEALPSGTGEYDFALLAIAGNTPGTPLLPSAFSFVPLAKSPPAPRTPVVIGSYAAQFLESSQIQSSLFPTIVLGSVQDVFTFVRNTIDVLALGGSAAAQEGSSGGGVAAADGSLVGTITTSTVEGNTSARSLSAITASYIRAEYASETGEALDILLNRPTITSITDFSPRSEELKSILIAQLP